MSESGDAVRRIERFSIGGFFAAKVADHGHPAFVRHHQVEEENVIRGLLQRGDGLAAGEKDVDAESVVAEDSRDETLHRRIVVEQKNALAALEEGFHSGIRNTPVRR